MEDILKYAQNVEIIVKGISFEEFTKDIRIYYSVMKNIEVIGEAANMLTRHFRETHAELPWRWRKSRACKTGFVDEGKKHSIYPSLRYRSHVGSPPMRYGLTPVLLSGYHD